MDEFGLLEDVARRQANRYWGKYRGNVTDCDDPEMRGRIKVTVPSVLGDSESQWAEAVFPYGGGSDFGFVAVPPVDSLVIVEFLEGDPSAPVWTGTFWRPARRGTRGTHGATSKVNENRERPPTGV